MRSIGVIIVLCTNLKNAPRDPAEALANLEHGDIGCEERHEDESRHECEREDHNFLIPEDVTEKAIGDESQDRSNSRACACK